MKAVVYVDMLFMINFLINITLLKITGIFIKRKLSLPRLCLSAVLGAIYAVCMFFPRIHLLYIFPCKFAVSLLMVMVVSGKCKIIRIIKNVGVFYLVSFTFAGVMLALIYFTGFGGSGAAVMSNGIFYFNITLKTLIAASAISYIILSLASTVFKRNKLLGIKKLTIYLGDRTCEITALSDTGNLLQDPISRTPVVIAEKEHLQSLFPCGVPEITKCIDSEIRLRVIPYSSLGKSDGIITGFVPDLITIDGRKAKNVIVGISDNALSPTDEYNALFNPNIIN